MLTLTRRACWLGCDWSGKVMQEDGRIIRTLSFQLDKLLLNERELNALLGEPHAWSSLYNDSPDGPMPFLKCFKSLEFEKEIDTAAVTLYYGLEIIEQQFVGVTLSKMKLALNDGGLTAFTCKVKTAPTLDETLARLFEHFGDSIEAELTLLPPNSQRDLPLNTFGGNNVAGDALAARGLGKGREGAIIQ